MDRIIVEKCLHYNEQLRDNLEKVLRRSNRAIYSYSDALAVGSTLKRGSGGFSPGALGNG